MLTKHFTVAGAMAPLLKVQKNLQAVIDGRAARTQANGLKLDSIGQQMAADTVEHDKAVKILSNLDALLNPDFAETQTEAA